MTAAKPGDAIREIVRRHDIIGSDPTQWAPHLQRLLDHERATLRAYADAIDEAADLLRELALEHGDVHAEHCSRCERRVRTRTLLATLGKAAPR